MAALLRARDLTKRYGAVTALDQVNFEIEPGITGLLGANGAGKSTAIKLFLGLLRPDGGHAEFEGVDISSRPEMRERIGYMPEHDCLPDDVGASEFLSYMAQVSGLPPTQARVRASDVLRHVGLGEERHRPIGTYSTGMKQRVKLAQALVHDPSLVLLDEPTAGLDPTGRQEMVELIRRIGVDFGLSIVLSTHLMGDVERTCDRIIVLDEGRVLEQGPVARFTSETETLAIQVQEGLEDLHAELLRRSVDCSVEHRAVIVEDVTPEDYDAIRDAIVASGALVYSLAPRQHSLTEIFLAPAAGEPPAGLPPESSEDGE